MIKILKHSSSRKTKICGQYILCEVKKSSIFSEYARGDSYNYFLMPGRHKIKDVQSCNIERDQILNYHSHSEIFTKGFDRGIVTLQIKTGFLFRTVQEKPRHKKKNFNKKRKVIK